MIRVLLVDDQSMVRTGFRTILESEVGIAVVGEAENGKIAIDKALELSPDVICMDVQMPVLDGLEATEEIVRRGAAGAVLMLTTFDRDDFLFRAPPQAPADSSSRLPRPNSSSTQSPSWPPETDCSPRGHPPSHRTLRVHPGTGGTERARTRAAHRP